MTNGKGHRYEISHVVGDAPDGVKVGAVLVENKDRGKEHTWNSVNEDNEITAVWYGKKIGTCVLPGIPISEFS